MDKNIRICLEKTIDNKNKFSLSQQDRAIFYKSKLWPIGSTITIGFLETPLPGFEITNFYKDSLDENGNIIIFDPLQQYIINTYSSFTYNDITDMIRRIVIERIRPIVNLNLVFIDNPFQANVRISFKQNLGSYSYIGQDCLKIPEISPTMNFGWFDVGTVLHEFGHVIGMVHEHQSPYINPIQWDKDKLYTWALNKLGWNEIQVNQQIIDKYNYTQLNGTVFDRQSIMLYFISNDLTLNNSGTKVNNRLSPYDVLYMNSIYPGSKQTPKEFYLDVYKENISSNLISNQLNNIKIFIIKNKIFIVMGVLLLYLIIVNICTKNLQ